MNFFHESSNANSISTRRIRDLTLVRQEEQHGKLTRCPIGRQDPWSVNSFCASNICGVSCNIASDFKERSIGREEINE
jgi:hypothetical protein